MPLPPLVHPRSSRSPAEGPRRPGASRFAPRLASPPLVRSKAPIELAPALGPRPSLCTPHRSWKSRTGSLAACVHPSQEQGVSGDDCQDVRYRGKIFQAESYSKLLLGRYSIYVWNVGSVGLMFHVIKSRSSDWIRPAWKNLSVLYSHWRTARRSIEQELLDTKLRRARGLYL